MQLNREDFAFLPLLIIDEVRMHVNNINRGSIEDPNSESIDSSVKCIERIAQSLGNRCHFCNRAELIMGLEKEKGWVGSVDLIINGSKRGNLICDSDECCDAYGEFMEKNFRL